MEISIAALGAGAQDHRSGGATRGPEQDIAAQGELFCPVERIAWSKVWGVGCDRDSGIHWRSEGRSDKTRQRQRWRSGSWSHGLRSGEFADENEPALVTVRTDPRLNQWHRFCVSRYKQRVDGVLR
jgi:hypothetical protein